MWQGDYFVVRKDTIVKEEVDGVEVEKESAITLQQITYGWIEREDPNAFDWAGTYVVNVKDVDDLDAEDGVDYSDSFEMEIVSSAGGGYTVTKFAGYEGEYYPSIELIPNSDGKSATMDLKGYYGFVMLQSFGEVNVEGGTDYAYHVLTDGNGESTSLKVTVNEDGTLSIEDFSISYYLWNANTYNPLVLMTGVSAQKDVEDVEKFEWVGDYTLTAEKVDVYYQGEDVAFPETFDVTISYFDGSAYGMESVYYISSFLNKNIEQMPIDFTMSEDGWSADMLVGGLCGSIVPGEKYYKIYDMNATDTPITITANADGTISIPGFFIKVVNYNTNEEQAGAFYQNVTLTPKAAGIENIATENNTVEGIYDLLGRKIDVIRTSGIYIVNGKKVVIK
jgi:hypothetical protein